MYGVRILEWGVTSSRNRIAVRAFSVLLFIVMVFLSVWFNMDSFTSMSFHANDFPYYLQLGPRLFDSRLTDHVNLNPAGVNFLGFYGEEATRSIHQAIHLEPIKYIDGVALVLLQSATAVFIERSLLCFLPLLYMAWVLPQKTNRDSWFVAGALLVYAALPAVIFGASFDLRPFQLLAPFLVMASLAVGLRRPLLEQLLLFNLMFIAREEALLFGLVLVAFEAVRWRMRSDVSSLRYVAGSWLIWAVITTLYYLWTGYPNKGLSATRVADTDVGFNPWSLLPLIVVGVVFLVYGLLWLRRRRFDSGFSIAIYGALLLPLSWQFYSTYHSTAPDVSLTEFIFSPRLLLWQYTLLVVAILMWYTLASERVKTWLLGGVYGVAVLSLITTAIHPASIWREWLDRREDIFDANAVWAIRAATDRYSTAILADKWAFQAFYDYEYGYMYDLLPWYIIQGEARREPQNAPYVQQVLETQTDFVIFHRNSREALQTILDASSVRQNLAFVEDNGRFTIYQILRDGKPVLSTLTPTTFGDSIRISQAHVSATTAHPGDTVSVTFPLQRLAAMNTDYNILVRLVDATGQEWWRKEGWPWGAPTSNWDAWEIRPDQYDIALPTEIPTGDYTITVQFYDPATFAALPVTPFGATTSVTEWHAATLSVSP